MAKNSDANCEFCGAEPEAIDRGAIVWACGTRQSHPFDGPEQSERCRELAKGASDGD